MLERPTHVHGIVGRLNNETCEQRPVHGVDSSRPPARMPLPSGGPAEHVQRTLAAPPPGDLRVGIAELTAIVNDLAAGVSQARARLAAVAGATYVGRAGYGKAIVTVTGAGVQDVRYEPRWLAGAHETTYNAHRPHQMRESRTRCDTCQEGPAHGPQAQDREGFFFGERSCATSRPG